MQGVTLSLPRPCHAAIPLGPFYPNLRAWVDRIKAREAVRQGFVVRLPVGGVNSAVEKRERGRSGSA